MRVQRTRESVVTGMPKTGDLKSEDTTICVTLGQISMTKSPVPPPLNGLGHCMLSKSLLLYCSNKIIFAFDEIHAKMPHA